MWCPTAGRASTSCRAWAAGSPKHSPPASTVKAAALVAAAALRGFAGLSWTALAITVVTIPFLEAGALRLAGAVGLHALSAAYIGLVWTFALLRPVREAGAVRAGWAMGTRPRIFENR